MFRENETCVISRNACDESQFSHQNRDLPLIVGDRFRPGLAKVENIGQARQDVLDFISERILGDADRQANGNGMKAVRKSTGQEDPATAIAKFTRRNKIDLIAIGTPEVGSIKGMLTGSVSRNVANACNVKLPIVR